MDGLASHLNGMTNAEARAALERCCGAMCWVDQMIATRPFANNEQVLERAEAIWQGLTPNDWLEAFEHHPRIGQRIELASQRSALELASQEQSGVHSASDAVRQRLEDGNRAYEERFGHVFLICATGRSGDELLAALEQRLENDAETELIIAAGEQAKITRLRILGMVRA